MAHGGKRTGSGRKKGSGQNPYRKGEKSNRHGGRRPFSGRKKGRQERRPTQIKFLIYIIHEVENQEICKIGVTSRYIEDRLSGLNTGNWRQLVLAHTVAFRTWEEALEIEHAVQSALMAKRINGEWFRVSVEDALLAIGSAMVRAAVTSEIADQKTLFD
jgi:hypothetical protein